MHSARQRQLIYAVVILTVASVGLISAALLFLSGDRAVSDFSTATNVEIWEGLPHPNMEVQTFLQESNRHKTRNLQSHAFYDTVGKLATADQQQLMTLLGELDMSRHYVNMKKCEFHPDYALCWSDGNHQYAILFCLGCGEIRTVHQGRERAFEMTSRKQYEALFKPYQRNRPSTEYFPKK